MLSPNDFANIKANVKVASTENGIIFGNIVYDVGGAGSDRNVVVLNDIHVDIMDYIVPASCTETEFRSMWAEFEWENKVREKPWWPPAPLTHPTAGVRQHDRGQPGRLPGRAPQVHQHEVPHARKGRVKDAQSVLYTEFFENGSVMILYLSKML